MSEDLATSSVNGHTSEVVAPDLRDPSHHDQLAPLPSTPLPRGDVVITDKLHAYRSQNTHRKMINHYEFERLVGKGQHGEVFLACDTKARMQVAIKAVRRKNSKVDKMNMLRRRKIPASPHTPLTDNIGSTEHKIRKEIAIMKKCRHPHVVRLLEVIDDKLNERIYMVMEYLGGGEIKWRTAAGDPVLRVDQARRICRDVILGLEYLHHQGIIHRDIKPANLLWTADRRTVKITDFGVSHFSYAQRLAAAGKGNLPDDQKDPILMDESDLSKTAGTPMFLAPEIIADSLDTSASSSTLHLTAPSTQKKPQITKAIDVWAFGVTLYGLLFGDLPFRAEQVYQIYRVIRKQDWDVPPTMGVDLIQVGGRHQRPQPKGEETEGHLVVLLLQRLLEKDYRKRITLDEVKRDPWILRDMANPQAWLRETHLDRHSSLEPTADETSSAMSSVRFHWSSRLTTRITSVLRAVRPQRSFRRNTAVRDHQDEPIGVNSVPNFVHHSRRSTVNHPHHHPSYRHHDQPARDRDKGKQRANPHSDLSRNKSSTDVSSGAVKGFEPWSMWGAPPSSSGSKHRRGSFNSRTPDMTLQVPSKSQHLGSPLPSPQGSSPGDGSGQQSSDERPRSRLSFSWVRHLVAPKHSYGPPPQEAGTSSAPSFSARRSRSGTVARESLSRRSDDAFITNAASRQSSGNGPLTLAMRAASWGEVADYARPSEDLASLYSGERDMLDEDTLLLGAGGVAQSPVPSIPSGGPLSTMSSMASISLGPAMGSVPPAMSAAQAILQRTDGVEHPCHASAADPAAQDVAIQARQSQIRSRATSPLALMSYHEGELSLDAAAHRRLRDAEYDDESVSSGASRSDEFDPYVALQPSTSQMYQDEDEESDNSDRRPLELRTRRPSVSADIAGPQRAQSPHRERPMISCI